MYGKMTRKLLCAMLVTGMVMAMSACGGGTSTKTTDLPATSSAFDAHVTLEIYHIWAGGDSKAEIMTQVLDSFQAENKNIKLNIQTDTTDAQASKIKVFAASGSMPDVPFVFTYSALDPIARSGSLMDMTSIFNEDEELKTGFDEGTVNAMTTDGKIYGVPMECNAEGVFYNKALFDKYGLTFPKTYTELKNVVSVFKKNGIIPITLGAKENFPAFFIMQFFTERQSGYSKLEDILEGKEKFENTEYINALNKFKELVDMGAFPKNMAAISYDMEREYFVQGKAAMIVDGTWDIPQYDIDNNQEFSKNIEFGNFPAFEDGKGDSNTLCKNTANGFAMSSKLTGAKKDTAIKLLKYLSLQNGARVFADNKVILACKNHKTPDSKAGLLLPKVLKLMGSTVTFEQYDNHMPGALGNTFYDASQEMALGGNPIEVLKKVDTVAKKELAKK